MRSHQGGTSLGVIATEGMSLHIKIQGTKLYVKSRLIGEASSTDFSSYPSLGDSAPIIANLSKSASSSVSSNEHVNTRSLTTDQSPVSPVSQPVATVSDLTVTTVSDQFATYLAPVSQPVNTVSDQSATTLSDQCTIYLAPSCTPGQPITDAAPMSSNQSFNSETAKPSPNESCIQSI